MTLLNAAAGVYVGSTAATAVYAGTTPAWSPGGSEPGEPITLAAHSAGTGGSAATVTVTLPTWTDGDYLLLVTSRNLAAGAPYTTATGTITELSETGPRRLTLSRLLPVSGTTTVTITSDAASLWTWACLNFGSTPPAQVLRDAGAAGNSTTSAVDFPAMTIPTAQGGEMVLAVAGTNSTATWTAPSGMTGLVGSGAAPGLLVATGSVTAGATIVAPASADRGSAGANRFETSLTVVLRP